MEWTNIFPISSNILGIWEKYQNSNIKTPLEYFDFCDKAIFFSTLTFLSTFWHEILKYFNKNEWNMETKHFTCPHIPIVIKSDHKIDYMSVFFQFGWTFRRKIHYFQVFSVPFLLDLQNTVILFGSIWWS